MSSATPIRSGSAANVTQLDRDPTVNDDASAGFGVGDVVVNTASGEQFVCVDNASGASIWREATSAEELAAHVAASAPHPGHEVLSSKDADGGYVGRDAAGGAALPGRFQPGYLVESDGLATTAPLGEGFTIQHQDRPVVYLTTALAGGGTSSGTAAIADGSYPGQRLLLIAPDLGTQGSGLTLRDGANTRLRGNWTRGSISGDHAAWLLLQWDGGTWQEIARDALAAGAALDGEGSFAAGSGHALSGVYAAGFGQGHSLSGSCGFAVGMDHSVSGVAATAFGSGCLASLRTGLYSAGGTFAEPGSAQQAIVVIFRQTDDATARVLTLNGGPPNAANELIVEPDRAVAFDATIVARRTDGTQSARFWRSGLVVNRGGTVALEGAVQTIGTDLNAPGWSVDVIANDASDSLRINATGPADASVRWVARVALTQVG